MSRANWPGSPGILPCLAPQPWGHKHKPPYRLDRCWGSNSGSRASPASIFMTEPFPRAYLCYLETGSYVTKAGLKLTMYTYKDMYTYVVICIHICNRVWPCWRKCVTVGVGFETLLLAAWKSVFSQFSVEQDVQLSAPSPAPGLPGCFFAPTMMVMD